MNEEQLLESVQERLNGQHPGLWLSGYGIAAFASIGVTGGFTAAFGIGAIAWWHLAKQRQRYYKSWDCLESGNIVPLLNQQERAVYERANGRMTYQQGRDPGFQLPPAPVDATPVETVDPTYTQAVWQRPEVPTSDIALSLAERPQSTLIVGQPGAGKGVLIAYALRYIKQIHPEIKIWAIDPKADPAEAFYWEPVDHLLSVPVRPFTPPEDMARICNDVKTFLDQFQASPGAKLIVIDEALTLKEKATKWFTTYLAPSFNALCSLGRSRQEYGWLVSQSPNASDFGVSGGMRNVYRRILLIHQSNQGLLANGSTYFSGAPEQALFGATGRVFFDSAINGWGAVPRYEIPQVTPQPIAPLAAVPQQTAQPQPQPQSTGYNFEALAAKAEASNAPSAAAFASFIRWLGSKRGEVIERRQHIILLWGNKQKPNPIASNQAIQPFIDLAVRGGLMAQIDEKTYQVRN